jgi:hypothetical protein
MVNQQLTEAAKHTALKNGADLVGVVNVNSVPEHTEDISRILPEAESIVVVASKHSLAALRSNNVQMGQFDTIHTYTECARAAHKVGRFLESKGFPSVAVPAFIPIDMAEPRNGFRYFAGFMQDLIQKPKSEMMEILRDHGLREMWQTFMTGSYYYCFQCQSQCPATNMPQTDRL